MSAAALAVLVLLQTPAATYRTGPLPSAPPLVDRSGTDADNQRYTPSYSIAPDALRLRPRLRATGVTIDAYDPSVEGFRAPEDRAYDAVVMGGAAAAQGRQGLLDGAWELRPASGTALYGLQLVQPADGEPVEGAWRKVAPGSEARISGFVLVAQEPGRLVLRFFEPGANSPNVVTLQPAEGGSWRGELVRDGAPTPVEMRRR